MVVLIIGLTGGISSGKSTVSKMFKELNIPVVDADAAAREVVEPGENAYQDIVEYFGGDILLETGYIDRKKLGSIVFKDEEKRKVLNKIVHPAVREKMRKDTKEHFQSGSETVVMDIPLLFESDLTHMVDKTLLVYVSDDIQLQRLIERDKNGEEDARQRIGSQMPLEEKRLLADEIIDNNGTIEETRSQLLIVLERWKVIHT
ncbi:dephospho-CoA kinase [Pseudalkalibacillus caeni]|uniref:dephospho-CoA kinase n=1 Tax=Exobacillus caeni TaxID=2574798 RepID=UPI0024827187|nr:dephospho-CoA kinase [Pseudalkalibacillus caeni]